MIFVVVGRSYSGKDAIASYIRKYYKGRVRKFKNYTTNMSGNKRTHSLMSLKQFEALPKDEIFYETEALGHIIFSKMSQFRPYRSVTYTIDDPLGLSRIDELGIPYVVIYATCDIEELKSRAVSDNCGIDGVLSRYAVTKDRMAEFEKSGRYNLYLDTSVVKWDNIEILLDLLLAGVDSWTEERELELHAPFICEMLDEGWLADARDAGFLQAPIRRL